MSMSMNSQAGRIETVLRARANEWVNMVTLHEASGSMAVHSRVAQLRETRGLTIENKVLKRGGQTVSLYRLVVETAEKQGELSLA